MKLNLNFSFIFMVEWQFYIFIPIVDASKTNLLTEDQIKNKINNQKSIMVKQSFFK